VRVLVTGATGFVGRHLQKAFLAEGDDVLTVGGPADETGDEPWARLDLLSLDSVREAVGKALPEGIIHLAGFSSVAKSHQEPAKAFAVNTLGTAHLLVAVRELVPRCRVLLVSTGEVYGPISAGELANEQMPLNPLSPYAASKASAETIGQQFFRGYGTQVVNARSFAHIGPGQTTNFVVPSLAAQVAAVKQGSGSTGIQVGNLDPVRDFLHVQDVVAAYRILLTKGEPGRTYNVCRGEGRSIRSLLDELQSLANTHAELVVDPARVRPVEIPWLVGNPGILRSLGWAPRYSVRDALQEVLGEQMEAKVST
jgi:GDP-4-dehydro-6-deoxy-D-mannose reductase